MTGGPSPRTEFVYNIDEKNSPLHYGPGASRAAWSVAVRRGPFKLIWGEPREMEIQGKAKKNKKTKDTDVDILQLYNVESDPSESTNLAYYPAYKNTLEDLKKYGIEMSTHMVRILFNYGFMNNLSTLDTSSKIFWSRIGRYHQDRGSGGFRLGHGCQKSQILTRDCS